MSVLDRERTVLEQVPSNLYIRGEWRPASGDGRLPVEDPSTGETLVEVADGQPEDALDALAAAAEKQAEWARPPATGAGRDPAPGLRTGDREGRRAGPDHDPGDGQGGGGVAGGDPLRGRVPALVLRGGRPHPRPLHGQHDRQGANPHDAPAGGAVRVRDPLELPHRDGHAQDRPGGCGGLHDGHQAGPADAPVDVRAGEDLRGGGAARGRVERDHLQALRRR